MPAHPYIDRLREADRDLVCCGECYALGKRFDGTLPDPVSMKEQTMTDHTPGSSWRVLAHEGAGRHPAVHMRSEDYDRAIFDELVVDRWFHIEQMDDDTWWMNIGGVTVWVTVGRHGGPRAVSVFAPEDYDGPQAGCDYRLAWRGFTDGWDDDRQVTGKD